jgi:hypothetical protein
VYQLISLDSGGEEEMISNNIAFSCGNSWRRGRERESSPELIDDMKRLDGCAVWWLHMVTEIKNRDGLFPSVG